MGHIGSVEKQGRDVLFVSKQHAKEQTEANDRHAEHKDLGRQPVLRQSRSTDQTRLGVQMDWGKTQTAAHLRCLVGKIPPVCSAFSATNTQTKGFHSFCWFCLFFSLPLSIGSKSPLILNSLCKNIKKDNPLDLIDTKPSAPPPHRPLPSAYGP